MKIFITHMHGDHVLGLPGMLQSMSLLGRRKELDVYGPQGVRDFVESVNRTVQFQLVFPLRIHEIGSGTALNEPYYEVKAVRANHLIPCLSYGLIEKPKPGKFNPRKAQTLNVPKGPLWKQLQLGQDVMIEGRIVKSSDVVGLPRPGVKLVYAVDTRPCSAVKRLASNADLLIHDGSFDDSMRDKAKEYGHSTVSEAANLARQARVKQLVLMHISAMYSNPRVLLRQAKKIHKRTVIASDLMVIEVKASE
jgi:ribonuclease Z